MKKQQEEWYHQGSHNVRRLPNERLAYEITEKTARDEHVVANEMTIFSYLG